MAVQLVPVGSYWNWANPLAGLAVIEPDCPLEMSLMFAWTPLVGSCRATCKWSPHAMKRSFVRLGVKVASVESSGLAGAGATPFLVTNANSKVSSPTLARQVGFWVVPLTGSSSRLKTFIAAHHLTGSHVPAPTATAQVGHGTHPGG